MSAAIVLFVLIVFGLAIFMSYAQTMTDKEDIQDYLKRQGASNIVVHGSWFSGGRGTHAYDVEYTDSHGVYHKTQCVGTAGEIYWHKPPEV